MNTPSLFSISSEVISLANDLEAAMSLENAQDPFARNHAISLAEDKLSTLMLKQDDKVSSIIRFIDSSDKSAEFMRDQIKKATEYVRQKEATIDRLQDLMKRVMLSMDIQELNGSDGRKATLRKTDRVEITDISKVPIEMTRAKIEADKTMIKGLLRQGIPVDGATLVHDVSLVIK